MSTSRYAIIKSGGKQYRVAKGDIIEVELLDVEPGAQVEFSDILFIGDSENDSHVKVGGPFISEYLVRGEMINISAGPKISSVKYKPSHHEYRKFGHRQHYSRIRITEIAEHKEQQRKQA